MKTTVACLLFTSALLFLGLTANAQTDTESHQEAASKDSSEANEVAKHDDHDTLPLPFRLAFMTGHVEAGLALYRAGEPKMAAPHLQHPVSETHASERVGLDALGFKAELFTVVSEALAADVPAKDIEPQLKAASDNLKKVSEQAGGNTADIIHFLLDTILEEYAIGVKDGKVTDPGEYQDAFGFTKVAIDHSLKLNEISRVRVNVGLLALLNTWPEAPVPPEKPTDPIYIEQLVALIRADLPPRN